MLLGLDSWGGYVGSISVCMGGKGSGDRDLGGAKGACLALRGVDPSREWVAACFSLFFTGENGLVPEIVSVLTARDLGMID